MDETVSFIKNAEYLIHWNIGEYDEKRNGNIISRGAERWRRNT